MSVEDQKEQSSFRVTYYAFGGRAAPLREAAVLGGISFEDKFITKEEHKEQKKHGLRRWSGPPGLYYIYVYRFCIPISHRLYLIELTIFDKDGKEITTIGQSNSCLRYIGNISGTYPEGNVERALVDEVLDSTEDVMTMFVKLMFIADAEEKKNAAAALMKKQFPYWFKKFESRLEENEKRGNKNGFFVGDSITIADLKFYGFASSIKQIDGYEEEVKTTYKRVAALTDNIGGNEKLKAFNEQFAKNVADAKENKKSEYKYAGKFVPGDL